MLSVFLDTNILIDAYCDTREFNKEAQLLLLLAQFREIEVCVSASQITDFVYIASKGEKKALVPKVQSWLKNIIDFVNIVPVTRDEVRAMTECDWEDLEDYIVYCSALNSGCKLLITHDKEGYKDSVIPHIGSIEFFDWYEKEYNIRYSLEDFANAI